MNFRDNFGDKPIHSSKIEYICEAISYLDTSRLKPQNREKAEALIDRLLYIGPGLHVEPDHPSLVNIIAWIALSNEFSDKWDALLNHFMNLDTNTLDTPEIEFQEQLTAIQNKYTGSRKILHDQIYSLMMADPDAFVANLQNAFDTMDIIKDKVSATNIYIESFSVILYSYMDNPDFDLSPIDTFTRRRIVMALFKILCLVSTHKFAENEMDLTGISPDKSYIRGLALQLFELFASSLHKDIASVLADGRNIANLYFEFKRREESEKPDSEILIACREYFGEDFSEEYLGTINTLSAFVTLFKSVYADNGFDHLFTATEL